MDRFFNVMLAAGGRICNGDAFEIRLLLRAIIFVSYIVVGLLGYFLARNAGAARSAALVGAAAIWAAPQLMMFWNITIRPEFPGLLLCFAGMWIITRRTSPALRESNSFQRLLRVGSPYQAVVCHGPTCDCFVLCPSPLLA